MMWVKRHTALFLFVSVFLVGAILIPSVGPAWDEPDNIYAGGVYVTFIQKGFDPKVLVLPDETQSAWGRRIGTQNPDMAHYPPVPIYVGTLFVLLFEKIASRLATSGEIIVLFHLATVFFLALLTSTVYRFGKLLGLAPAVSIFAALATFLYPTVFGHGLSNLKDTAQMALFTLSLYYLVRARLDGGMKDLLMGAVVWGLAIATKFNAVYVPIVWGLWVAMSSAEVAKKFRSVFSFKIGFVHIFHPKEKVKPDKIFSLPALFHDASIYLFVIAVGLVTAFAVWPYLWFDPIGRIGEVVQYFTTIGRGYALFWDGTLYMVGKGKPMWWYPWQALGLVTPPVVLVLGVLGTLGMLLKKIPRERLLLVLWLVIPFVRTILPGAAFYDAIRHFMEVIPAFILLAAFGLSDISAWGVFGKKAALALAIAGIALLVEINATYFPYSTGYYNSFARDPNMFFDRDLSGLSVKESIDWIHRTRGAAAFEIPIAAHLSWYYLQDTDGYVTRANHHLTDTIILIHKLSHIKYKKPGEIDLAGFVPVHTITRGNALFATIYRRK